MFGLREIFRHLGTMRHYLIFSCVIMLAGIVVGATNPGFDSFIQGQMAGLQQMADTIDNSSNPTLWFMVFIFFNNAIKSIIVMYLGAILGIVPFIFLAINGMMIGYIASITASQGGDAMLTLMKGLLPHGIIEIPAIIIACAYGFRFGAMMFKGIGSLAIKRPGWGKDLEQFVMRTLPAMVFIVGLLLIAAVIESTFTLWLLGK
jgi:stage II sporulation protein M